MANLQDQLKSTWQKLPARSRWTILGASAAVILGIGAIQGLASRGVL